MREIQASEAKTHLPKLLDDVEHGETIVITRHGRAIARLIPDADQRQADINAALDRIERRRKQAPTANVDELLAWRHEDHRY